MTWARMARERIGAVALALVLALPAGARAQAFLQWAQAARALGMSGAAAGLSDDPSAAFLSPAAIVLLPGTQVHLGGTLGARGGSFDAYGAPDADADTRFAAAPVLYATHAIAEGLAGGLSITTPWRADVGWRDPETFVGRFRATEVRLRGLVVNPVVAYETAPNWSVAVGIAVADVRLSLRRFEQDPALSALGGGGPIALAFGDYGLDGTGVGWNAAAFWRPTEDLAAGVQFRSGIGVSLNGDVDFTIVAPEDLRRVVAPDGRTIGEQLDRTYIDQTARSRLDLPAIAVGGAAWSPIAPVVLAADVQWSGWGSVDDLPLAFADTTLGERTPLDYEDAWALRLGAEVHPIEDLRVRVGFAREWSPAPLRAVSPLLPDADRSAVSFGAGYRWMGTELDIGYRLAVLADREGVAFPANTSAPDGRFESVEHRLAIGATRRF